MGLAGTRLAFAKLTLALSTIGLAGVNVCFGQLCATTHTTELYCLLPYTFHTQAAPFNAIFTPFGTELSELPMARPAGGADVVEKGDLVSTEKSLGPIFTERGETLDRNRIFVGITYQNFTFSSIDGMSLKQLPIVLYYAPLQVYTPTISRIDLRVGQYALVAAVRLTSRMDISVAIPFERVSLSVSVNGNEYGPGGVSAVVSEHVPGAASGISDVVVGTKQQFLDRGSFQAAAGLDIRIPSGNELNFLGSGAWGVRPYIAMSRQRRIDRPGKNQLPYTRFSEHLNFGYQWNGDSILNPSSTGNKQGLPTNLFYNGGGSYEATKRLSLTADLIGRTFFNSPRLAAPTAVAIPGIGNALSVQPYVGALTTTDLSLGCKVRTRSHLVVTANATLKLNSAGLRARTVPLAGLSYTF